MKKRLATGDWAASRFQPLDAEAGV